MIKRRMSDEMWISWNLYKSFYRNMLMLLNELHVITHKSVPSPYTFRKRHIFLYRLFIPLDRASCTTNNEPDRKKSNDRGTFCLSEQRIIDTINPPQNRQKLVPGEKGLQILSTQKQTQEHRRAMIAGLCTQPWPQSYSLWIRGGT